MPGIVNSRRNFIGQEMAAALEKLDCQHTGVVECFKNPQCCTLRFFLQGRRKRWSRRQR
jgi:hypothetical protein